MNVLRYWGKWLAGGSIGIVVIVFLGALLNPTWWTQLFPHGFSAGVFSLLGALSAAAAVLLLALVTFLDNRVGRTEAAEAKLQALLESIPACGILIIDREGRIVSANSQTEFLFGYSQDELQGQVVTMLWGPPGSERRTRTGKGKAGGSLRPPTEQDRLESGRSGLRPESSRPDLAEMAGKHKDGTKLTLEVNCSPPVPTSAGPLTILILRDVTARKQTELALREREAHLRLVVEQMPAILWTTDADLQITSTTGAGLAALDLDPRQVVGMTMLEHLGKENVESTPIAAHLAALRGQSLSYEMEWKNRTFQVRVDPLRDAEKTITGTIGIVLDVTDRKRTMAELEARARQQAAVATLGQRALAGGDFLTLLGEAAALVAQTLGIEYCQVLEAVPEKKGLRLVAGHGWKPAYGRQTMLDGGTNSQAGYTLLRNEPVVAEDLARETRFRPSHLLQVHGATSGVSVLIPGKGGVFGVLGAHTRTQRKFTTDDIHFLQAVANVLATTRERKQAEEAQTRLVAILEATTDVVVIAGSDQRILYLNRAGRDLMGLGTDEEVAARTIADLFPDHAHKLYLSEGLPTAIRKGAWSGEATLRRAAGTEVPVSQLILAHRGPGGNVEFFSTIARDISERLHLEGQFRQAQKMEAVGRLAGGIAHDFNNLLCVITGYCDFLLGGLGPDDRRRTYVKEIRKAGERAAGLTRQLLAFSRKQMLTPRVFNLNGLIGNMNKMLGRLIGEDVELATALDPALAPVKADPGQMEQVLMNLAVNARDAMPAGGKLTIVTGNVVLNADYVREHPEAVPGPYVLLAVSDTGCGMNAEVQAHLFEPFFTTKGVGKGTGLGLATVFGIVKQSGGHIDVRSAPGEGATFRVYLPRVANGLTSPEPVNAAAQYPRGTETVLLVEDESGVRALARQILQVCGYTVLEACDGSEALGICENYRGPIHLLLSDVVMPKVSGGRLSQLLRPLHPKMKVLFMSGYTDSNLFRYGVQTGEVDCILKPFTAETLARHVREVLDRPQTGPAPAMPEASPTASAESAPVP